ncbi:hypothetical protein [Saccharothrix luteola]|uniref:hypothetical protein n=1 Tax=Saccharothrix luteola TaxID=2893018 RepID=UPI001E427FDF|nr:hypothetical protein [Saccharothrix luteola]MCC8250010.1 hypothetical protein [Saccharothrix luteola]
MSGSNVRLVGSVQARGFDGEPRERHPAAGPPEVPRHEPNGDDLTGSRSGGVLAACGDLPSCRKESA